VCCEKRQETLGIAGWALCTIPAVWVGISLLRRRGPIADGKALSPKTAG
jgi:hypothetical protein